MESVHSEVVIRRPEHDSAINLQQRLPVLVDPLDIAVAGMLGDVKAERAPDGSTGLATER